MIRWGEEDALQLGIGVESNIIAITGYFSDVKIPLKNKLEATVTRAQLETIVKALKDNALKGIVRGMHLTPADEIVTELTNIINTNPEQIFITVPLVVHDKSTVKITGVIHRDEGKENIVSLSTLLGYLGSCDKSQYTITFMPEWHIVINGMPFTQDDMCRNCVYRDKRIHDRCWLKVSTMNCVINSLASDNKDTESAKLACAPNLHETKISMLEEESSPDDINSGGGIYYV